MITPNQYQELAMAKEADQEVIRQRIYDLGVMATRLDNAARGLSDDAGEVSGAIKKWLEYGQELDKVNLIEEVGDCLWRLAQIMHGIGSTMEEAMEANIRKLNVRYKQRLTEHEAAEANRDRQAEAEAVKAKTV